MMERNPYQISELNTDQANTMYHPARNRDAVARLEKIEKELQENITNLELQRENLQATNKQDTPIEDFQIYAFSIIICIFAKLFKP